MYFSSELSSDWDFHHGRCKRILITKGSCLSQKMMTQRVAGHGCNGKSTISNSMSYVLTEKARNIRGSVGVHVKLGVSFCTVRSNEILGNLGWQSFFRIGLSGKWSQLLRNWHAWLPERYPQWIFLIFVVVLFNRRVKTLKDRPPHFQLCPCQIVLLISALVISKSKVKFPILPSVSCLVAIEMPQNGTVFFPISGWTVFRLPTKWTPTN